MMAVVNSGPSSDKRVERSIDAVLTETYRLLTETGMGGVSVDEISRRSGVAKTTIYRHWPSRSALLLEACSKIGGPRETPHTGSFARDIGELVRAFVDQLRTAQWPSALPSIIDAAERDPDVASTLATLHEELMSPFTTVIERGLASGELRTPMNASDVVAALVGPLFYRRWFSNEPIDDDFVARLLDRTLRST